MKKLILTIVLVVTLIGGYTSYQWIKVHGWNRPYIEWGIQELAEHLVKNNLSPRGCLDLVWHGIGQQEGEARAECIYKYAKLTKDPSACELLMPSSYGLSCVGGAMTGYVRPCAFGNDRSVSWKGGKATLKECVSGNSNECCIAARARFIKDFNDCSSIMTPLIKDQCLRGLAFKNFDPGRCSEIQEKRVQAACLVEASALQKNPSICDGCILPLKNTEELW